MDRRLVLPAFAAAVLLTGCGSHDDRGAVRSTDRPTMTGTARDDRGGVLSEAAEDGREMMSDVAEGGREVVSEAAEDGREMVSEAAEGVKDELSDGDGRYRTDDDGKVHD